MRRPTLLRLAAYFTLAVIPFMAFESAVAVSKVTPQPSYAYMACDSNGKNCIPIPDDCRSRWGGCNGSST